MDHAVKLTINGETREFPMGITYKEVVKEYEKTSPAPVILVIAGGKICELHKKAERDGEVRLVTTGFINLFGLPLKMRALMLQAKKK